VLVPLASTLLPPLLCHVHLPQPLPLLTLLIGRRGPRDTDCLVDGAQG